MTDYIITRDEGFIYVQINGEQRYELFDSLIETVYNECKKASINRVLIDLRESTGMLSVLEKYELAELPLIHKIFGFKWAYLDNPSTRADGFVGTVAENRGIHAKLFFDKDEAVTWLLS